MCRWLQDGPRQLFQTDDFVARDVSEEDDESATALVAVASVLPRLFASVLPQSLTSLSSQLFFSPLESELPLSAAAAGRRGRCGTACIMPPRRPNPLALAYCDNLASL
jgi:hypothetical protein